MTPQHTIRTRGSWLSRALKIVGALLALTLLALFILGVALNKPLPAGTSGSAAEALAQKMLASVNDSAWAETGAVSWTSPRGYQHLWDRKRHLARVIRDDVEVLVDLNTKHGVATRAGRRLTGEEAAGEIASAWAWWANDSFWLNPVAKIFDHGTTRGVVTLEENRDALLVTFSGGGVTPGDSYLWILDEEGRPEAWQMWVSIIPIGGLEVSWEGWTKLNTGAVVSSMHEMSGLTLELRDIKGARALKELEPGPDPFEKLLNKHQP